MMDTLKNKFKDWYIKTPEPKMHVQNYHHKSRITIVLPDNMSNKNVGYKVKDGYMKIRAGIRMEQKPENYKEFSFELRKSHVEESIKRDYNEGQNWVTFDIYGTSYELMKIEKELNS